MLGNSLFKDQIGYTHIFEKDSLNKKRFFFIILTFTEYFK